MPIGAIIGGIGSAIGLGNTISNAVNGGGSSSPAPNASRGGYASPASPGAGLADLYGFFSPIGNELKGLGINSTDYQPVTGMNLTGTGYNASLQDNNGKITGGVSTSPNNYFAKTLPNLYSSFGNLAKGAGYAGKQFLENVTGGPGGMSTLLAPLSEIEMAREKANSDIEGTLSERGLSGSSFATNAIANSDANFGQAASNAALQLSQGIFGNELQTLNSQGNFIQDQSTLANQELAREIQQLQLEGQLGTNVSDALTRNSSTLAQLAAAAAAGRAHALANAGYNLGPAVGSAAKSALGNLLGLGNSGSNSGSSGSGYQTGSGFTDPGPGKYGTYGTYGASMSPGQVTGATGGGAGGNYSLPPGWMYSGGSWQYSGG